ncbi:dTDP-4-dehydrorhamnose reductase [Woodsholea maritima]|uniref:dTDP-4-dehydrorhamnose reductase n=1 Tax=Woodsholea maritima TaxID=240237 RepID=UPI00035D8943|nr:dTDP-4-dehydrorhamnose reductase [Woodsholea maritima]
MRILVTGHHGQVVSALVKAGVRDGVDVMACGRPQLDLADLSTLDPALQAVQPDVVINAAAYTGVDKAESEVDLAHAINAIGAGELARLCAAKSIPILQVSTDYVFAGDKVEPYQETDPVAPLGVYGQSKLAGEVAVARENPRHVIVRTAWVYSETGHNFLKTMVRLGVERDHLRVVADQWGSPTHADDIAAGLLKIAQRLYEGEDNPSLYGVFHMVSAGYTSWYGFAEAIFAALEAETGKRPSLEAIKTQEYPTPAPRPANSKLDCTKINQTYGVALPDWQNPIEKSVKALVGG